MSLFEVRSRSAIGLDDSFREKVHRGLSGFWHVGGKDVVVAAIFTDDHDDVFDRRGGLVVVVRLGLRCRDQGTAERKLKQSERSQSDAQAVHRICSKTLQGHASS